MTHDKTSGLDPNILGAVDYSDVLADLNKCWISYEGGQKLDAKKAYNFILIHEEKLIAALQSKREVE